MAAFTSPDVERIGRQIGFPIAVIDVVEDPAAHARTLSDTWHGCWQATDAADWYLPFDYGDTMASTTRFRQIAFDERWLGRAPLPTGMRISSGCLEVDLTPGVRRTDVRQAFGQAMAELRFDAVAKQPARVRQRFASGRKLVVSSRYAAPPAAGCDGRVTLVDDIYAFRPRAFPSVVEALEASVRILSMCSALAGAATADARDA